MKRTRVWDRLRTHSRRFTFKAALGAALLVPTLAVSCDQDAQAVFRQTATGGIAQGVKEVLDGNSDQGMGTIVDAAIDGLVASIQQAGDGPPAEK